MIITPTGEGLKKSEIGSSRRGILKEEEIFVPSCMCQYEDITLGQKEKMQSYFDLVDYRACEYSFMTIYMWHHVYNTRVMYKDDTMYVFGHDTNGYFSIVPVSKTKQWEDDLKELEKIFKQCFSSDKIIMRAVPEEYLSFIEEKYPGRFRIIKERDVFDYLYDGEKMRTLSGRKLHSKKNHYNAFVREYEGRYEYRRLTTRAEFDEALALMDTWAEGKEEFDYMMRIERHAVSRVFECIDHHPGTKVAGIYIDGKLEAFTLADMLTEDTVCVHIEKANAEIRGLYVAISKLFLENEYPDVKFVNREDDMGHENLRKAKESYYPVSMVEKYTLIEKAC